MGHRDRGGMNNVVISDYPIIKTLVKKREREGESTVGVDVCEICQYDFNNKSCLLKRIPYFQIGKETVTRILRKPFYIYNF